MTQEVSDSQEQPKPRTPLPWVQLLTLFLIQFSEPITATVVYPFVPQFIRDTGITGGDEKRVGYYAGIIESTFFVAEGMSVYHWAILSEQFGRRPALVFAPLGLAMSMIGFGFSTTFWSMILSRFSQGIFNGSIGVSKTVMVEITDPSNIGDAFSYNPMMWVSGAILGPLLGGTFANPVLTWPNSFGKIALFIQHPYLLPCLAAALVCILCFVIGFIIIEETGPKHKKRKLPSPESESLVADPAPDYGATGHQNQANGDQPKDERTLNFTELMKHRRVRITIIASAFLAFSENCYSALIPLVYSTSIEAGGLGLRPDQIGRIMASFAVLGAFSQALVFKRIMRRFGNRNSFILSLCGLAGAVLAFPFVIYLTRRAGRVDGFAALALVVQLLCASFLFMGFASMSVMIVDSSPSKASLSTTSGLGQVVATGVRALGPTVASSLFSLSLQHNLLGGNFVYIFGLSVLLIGIRVSFYLPEKMQMVQ